MNREAENNKVRITGTIQSPFEYSHKTHEESFYSFILATQRNSGVYDCIPIIASERLIKAPKDMDMTWKRVTVVGQFRSYNVHDETGDHLKLYVFARELSDAETEDENSISIDGYICRKAKYRRTSLSGRKIADMILSIRRPYRKSDYIPCICWGKGARFISESEAGTHIQAQGRIQSREYIKTFDDGTTVRRTAYEVSIGTMEVIPEGEGEADEC